MKSIFMSLLMSCAPVAAMPDGADGNKVKIGGTIRGKYEYQTDSVAAGRFVVRTARVNVTGSIGEFVDYKAEIDLCDEGKIKMLDAWCRLRPWRQLSFTIGQMRVPFTIDAHRSPHRQYFANRSFIAKQAGNVRDVGAMICYNFNAGFPIIVEGGLYNGSGLTEQKDFWTNSVNFSGKAQMLLPCGLNVVLGAQKVRPDDVDIMMYDAGMTFHHRNLVVEAEYLYKHYEHGAFHPVHAFNAFANYDIAIKNCFFKKVSPLVRYDFMTDHSDGKRYLVCNDNGEGPAGMDLTVNDYSRSRLTGGVTLSVCEPFDSDIRINYEKYFYRRGAVIKPSEHDKLVVELMVHF